MTDDSLTELIDSLAELETTVPTGWFRSMHLARFLGANNPFKNCFPKEMFWPDIDLQMDVISHSKNEKLSALIKEVDRNAWLFGKDGDLSLLDILWSNLSPTARGYALAGASERSKMDWVIKKWELGSPVIFEAVSATQICCNLIRDRRLLQSYRQKFLTSVLETAMAWGEQTIERLEDFNGESQSRWADEMVPLSQRAIDRCLEAAVKEGDAETARFCLAAGADPDIGIWCLDRSSNSRYCALSYAIAKSTEPTLADALLAAGADPSGTDYDGRNRPLYSALARKKFNLAESLLDMGATFTGGEKGQLYRLSKKRDKVEDHPSLNLNSEDTEWAEKRIGSIIPLKAAAESSYYYHGYGIGSYYQNFLGIFLRHNDLRSLRRFEARGLPIELSAKDLLKAISSGSSRCLPYILERMDAPREVMLQIHSRFPDFAKERLPEHESLMEKPKKARVQKVMTLEDRNREIKIRELEEKLRLAGIDDRKILTRQQIYEMQPLEYRAESLALEWRIFAQFKEKCPLQLKPMVILSELSQKDLKKWDRLMKKHLGKLSEEFSDVFPSAEEPDLNMKFPDTFPNLKNTE